MPVQNVLSVQHAEKPLHILSAGSIQFVDYDIGFLQDFIPLHASDSTHTKLK
jgi:hypothetical protein